MLPQSRFVNAFPASSPLRLADGPPEPHELATPLSIAEAQARQQGEHFEWVAQAFAEYRQLLVFYTFKRTEDFQLAQDIVQEAFVLLMKADRSHITAVRGWLCVRCRHLVMKAFAATSKMRRARRFSDFREDHEPVLRASTQTPAQIAQYHDLRDVVDGHLATLSPKARERMALRIYDPPEYGEAESAYGVDANTMLTSTYHAIRGLRAKFSDSRPKNKPPRIRLAARGYKHRLNYLVFCIDLDRAFETARDAAETTGIERKKITAALCGKQATAGEYRWEWRERKDGPRGWSPTPAHLAYLDRRRAAAALQA